MRFTGQRYRFLPPGDAMMPDGRVAHRLPPFEQRHFREFKVRAKNQFRNIRKPGKTPVITCSIARPILTRWNIVWALLLKRNRTNARRSVQHRATIRNFPVDAENYWTLNCIEPAADGMRKNPAIRYSNDGKSQKSRPPGFPNRNSLFALAIGKPGWRLDSNAQRY